MDQRTIVWTEYMKYRIQIRNFDPATVEHILRYSPERYVDTVTGRLVVIGLHNNILVMIPYEQKIGNLIPVTVHSISRQQVKSRLKSGRFANE